MSRHQLADLTRRSPLLRDGQTQIIGRFQSADYDHLIVAKDALDVLDEWVEVGDK